jgi:hypothetical protein
VYLRVNHENGEQVYETSRSDYLITDIYGEVNITLKRPAGSIHQLSQPLMVGEYNVYAEHPDDWYYKYINNTSTFRVLAVDSYLAVDNVVLDYGESVNLTVTADGAEGITAKIGSDNVAVKGYAILISGLNGGTYNLTVTTVPDSNHNPVTKTVNITVNKAKTVLVADAINTIYNVNKDLVITLKDANGNPVTGVDVTVNLNGAKTYTTDNRGQAKVPTAGLIPKTYTAKISFAGNTNYIGSSAEVKVIIKKASPKLTAKKKTFKKSKKVKKYTVTLKDNKGKAIKKAKVTIKIGKKTYKATTNSKGKAVFKINKLTKKGKYNAKITYKGNYLYNMVTKKVKITVK